MPKSARLTEFIHIRPQGFDYPCTCGKRVFNTPMVCRCTMADDVRRETRADMRSAITFWRNVAFGWASIAITLGALLLREWLR